MIKNKNEFSPLVNKINKEPLLIILVALFCSCQPGIFAITYGGNRDFSGIIPASDSNLIPLDSISNISLGKDVYFNEKAVHASDDPLLFLGGVATGVLVESHSGQPGIPGYLSIRGVNSLFFNQDPLFIVDGNPVHNLVDLNLFDIETFEIIKDISLLSRFGFSGSNGTMRITTKRGEKGKNRVHFNTSFGVTSVPGYLNLLNGNESFSLMKELNFPLENTPNDKSIYWGDGNHVSGEFINENDLKDINWQDRLFRNGYEQNYNLSFSGGLGKTLFRVAASYTDERGIVKPSGYSRMTLLLNLDREVNNRVNLSSGILVTSSEQNLVNTTSPAEEGGVILSALATPPFLPITDPSGDFFINPLRPEINNVDANIAGTDHSNSRNAILGNIKLDIKLFPSLKLKLAGGSNISLDREHLFLSTKHVYEGRISDGRAKFHTIENVLYNTSLLFSYYKLYNKHKISFETGVEYTGGRNSYNASTGTGFPSDLIKLVGAAQNKISWSNLNDYDLVSFPVNVMYNYNNKYLLGLTYNTQGSSRFSNSVNVISDPVRPEKWEIKRDRKWFSAKGIQLTWRIGEENLFKGSRVISDLNLNTGYGITYNDGGYFIGRSYPYYWNAGSYSFNADEEFTETLFGKVGFDIFNLQNLLPEQTREFNAGINMSFFKGRFDIDVNYYSRNILDILLPDSDTSYSNIGELSKNGFELNIESMNFSRQKFAWITRLGLSKLNSRVIETNMENSKITIGFNQESNIIKKGEPPFGFYVLETAGIFQDQVEVENSAIQVGASPGDIKYKDNFTDGIIDDKDRLVLGNPNPDLVIHLSNTFVLSRFEISMLFSGVLGQDILNLTRVQTEGINDWINQSARVLNRWNGLGWPSDMPASSLGSNNTLLSDRYIEDGSYVRLKNVSIRYQIPDQFFSKLGVESIKIYVTASNLVTFTRYSGYDPEVSMMGPLNIDYGMYPNPRFVGGGLSVSF